MLNMAQLVNRGNLLSISTRGLDIVVFNHD